MTINNSADRYASKQPLHEKIKETSSSDNLGLIAKRDSDEIKRDIQFFTFFFIVMLIVVWEVISRTGFNQSPVLVLAFVGLAAAQAIRAYAIFWTYKNRGTIKAAKFKRVDRGLVNGVTLTMSVILLPLIIYMLFYHPGKGVNNNTDPFFMLAEAEAKWAMLNRNSPTAIEKFSEAIKRNPNDVDLYKNRGACYLSLAQNDKALNDVNKIISLASDPAELASAYYLRANFYLSLNQYQNCVADCTKALSVCPMADGSYYRVRAMAYKGLGRYDLANQDIDTADAPYKNAAK